MGYRNGKGRNGVNQYSMVEEKAPEQNSYEHPRVDSPGKKG